MLWEIEVVAKIKMHKNQMQMQNPIAFLKESKTVI